MLKIKKDGNDSLSIEHKEGIQIISHKSMDLLMCSLLNNNNNNNNNNHNNNNTNNSIPCGDRD